MSQKVDSEHWQGSVGGQIGPPGRGRGGETKLISTDLSGLSSNTPLAQRARRILFIRHGGKHCRGKYGGMNDLFDLEAIGSQDARQPPARQAAVGATDSGAKRIIVL